MSMPQDDRQPFGNRTQAGDGAEKSATEASQGTKTGHIRWVLVVSLLLGVIVLGAAYATYTASHHRAVGSPAAQAALASAPGAV